MAELKSRQLTSQAEFKNKKIVLVSVPGAFTPTCSVSHLPSYLSNKEKLKAQGVDQVIVIAFNDAWVQSAWGKANGVKDDYFVSFILFFTLDETRAANQ